MSKKLTAGQHDEIARSSELSDHFSTLGGYANPGSIKIASFPVFSWHVDFEEYEHSEE